MRFFLRTSKYLSKLIASLPLVFLLMLPILSEAQVNLLDKTESQIKTELPAKSNAIFDEAKYRSDDGVQILFFKFPNYSPLLMASFYMRDSGKCYCCVYTYKNDSHLDELVNSVKSQPGWIKIPDKFEFMNPKNDYYIRFVRSDDGQEVSMTFNSINK